MLFKRAANAATGIRGGLARLAAVTLATGVLAGPAAATVMLDQGATAQTGGVAYNVSLEDNHLNVPLGQSFTAGLNGTFAAFDFISNFSAVSGSVTYDVRLGGGTGGTVLGSGSQGLSCTTIGGYCHIVIDISDLDIEVTAGQQYTFLLTGASNTGNFAVATGSNYYGGGQAYLGPDYNFYTAAGTVDLYFKTYVDVAPAVPEPAMLGLFGLGAVGLGFSRRRKNGTA